MAKVLVTWKSNWADEMNIEGFKIMDEADWKFYKAELKNLEKRFSICVGTNEEIDYDCGSDLLAELDVKKLRADDAQTLIDTIGEDFGFTQFANVDTYYEEEVEEQEEENWLTQDDEDDDENY